jgi:hypothetical protein
VAWRRRRDQRADPAFSIARAKFAREMERALIRGRRRRARSPPPIATAVATIERIRQQNSRFATP